MPLPTKQPNEKLREYLKRCIPVEIEAGKSQEQAAAICIREFQEQSKNKGK